MGKLKFIDLFCGIGGFRIALKSLGHDCVFSSDLDKDAQHTYKVNFDETPVGDITKVDASVIPEHQILCGGFPCQPFSISGNQAGFQDSRGTLLHEILRIADHHQPEVLFLENVRNYVSHAGGETLAMTLTLMEEAGYDPFFKVLNSSDFGIPQKRERLYFACFRKDLRISEFEFPQPTKSDVAVEDILLLGGDPMLDDLFIEREDLTLAKEFPESREKKPIRVGTVGKGGQGERIYSSKGHAITLSAYGGGIGAKTGIYLINERLRRLHPRECARLMGFPESFKLHNRRNVCYKLLGNSVVIPVVKKIFQEIEKSLSNIDLKAA